MNPISENAIDEVMRKLMRDDLIRERTNDRTEDMKYGVETVATRMIRRRLPADEIMVFTELPLSQLEELADKLGATLSLPAEEAMDILEIPNKERTIYAEMLAHQ